MTTPVLNLNNEVVKLRKEVKKIRVLTIRKLTRHLAKLKSKKGTEEDVLKNQRRAQRLLGEIHAMKELKPDDVTKTALQKEINFEKVCKKQGSTAEERAIARLATHPQFKKKIDDIKAAVKAFKDERRNPAAAQATVDCKSEKDSERVQSVSSDVETSLKLVCAKQDTAETKTKPGIGREIKKKMRKGHGQKPVQKERTCNQDTLPLNIEFKNTPVAPKENTMMLASPIGDMPAISIDATLAALTDDVLAAPAEDMPAAPAEDMPAAPAEDMPATPAEDMPAAPAEDMPATPPDVPAAPTMDAPATPAEDVPAAPAEGAPAAPAEGAPAAPAEGAPAAPAEGAPAAPAEGAPAAPAEGAPAAPAEGAPAAPAEDALAAPTHHVHAAPKDGTSLVPKNNITAAPKDEMHVVPKQGTHNSQKQDNNNKQTKSVPGVKQVKTITMQSNLNTKKELDDDSSDIEESDEEAKEYFDDSTEERFHKQSSGPDDSDGEDDFFIGKVKQTKKKKGSRSTTTAKAGVDVLPKASVKAPNTKAPKLESVFCHSLAHSREKPTVNKRHPKDQPQRNKKEDFQQNKPLVRTQQHGKGLTAKHENKKQQLQQPLHPSWEASRKRKEQQQSILTAFQGKKIKFDD